MNLLQGTDQGTQAPPAPTTGIVLSGDGSADNPITGVITSVPSTREEVSALRAQRRELSDQLQSAVNRRNNLARSATTAEPTSKAGLEARIQLLDARILDIEAKIASTGDILAQAPGGLLTSSGIGTVSGGPRMDVTAVSIMTVIFVMSPIAIAIARLVWKRATSGAPPRSAIDRESAERLQRLENSVDAIAIEMERVSEGQRFVTKLLSEQRQLAGGERVERGN